MSVNGKSIVLAGFTGSTLSANVLSTADGNTFTTIGRLAQPVRYAAVTATGNTIWLIGGETETGEGANPERTDVIQTFDAATGRSSIVGHMPTSVSHATAFDLQGNLLVAGGRTDAGATSAVLSINTATGAATGIATLPQAESDAPGVVIGNSCWLIGGETAGPKAPLNTAIQIIAG